MDVHSIFQSVFQHVCISHALMGRSGHAKNLCTCPATIVSDTGLLLCPLAHDVRTTSIWHCVASVSSTNIAQGQRKTSASPTSGRGGWGFWRVQDRPMKCTAWMALGTLSRFLNLHRTPRRQNSVDMTLGYGTDAQNIAEWHYKIPGPYTRCKTSVLLIIVRRRRLIRLT